MIWRFCNWLAKFGFFRSTRYGANVGYRGPEGQVRYRDGGVSVPMPLGNAHDYARMFGGEVVPPEIRVGTDNEGRAEVGGKR